MAVHRSGQMHSRIAFAVCLACFGSTFLQGCGGGDSPTPAPAVPTPSPTPGGRPTPNPPAPTLLRPTPPPTPNPTTPAPTPAGFECISDLKIPSDALKNMSQKGVAVDDTSLFSCPDKLPKTWPNTEESSVKYLRLFKAYRPEDSAASLLAMREKLAAHVKANGIKVLVGSQITCSKEDDEKDWVHVKELMKILGKDHVLGLAVGNELDQMAWAHGKQSCFDMIWKEKYLYKKTVERINEARTMLGNPDLPVTSVMTAAVIWTAVDNPQLGVRAYYKEAKKLSNWVFTFNYYPMFDPNVRPDPGGKTCNAAVSQCKCFDTVGCKTIVNVVQTRKYLKDISAEGSRLWAGELGWSSPAPATFRPPIASCKAFTGEKMLYDYYRNFLEWDLNYDGGEGPEIAFYFTFRDSANFGNAEYFGLVKDCSSTACKLTKAGVEESNASQDASPETLLALPTGVTV